MPTQAFLSNPLFERSFRRLLGIEGEFSNDPDDSGGATKWGITEAVAASSGYQGYVGEMDIDTAAGIYKHQYWDALRLDEVAEVSEAIAYELFDTGVNMGPGTAARFLQRSLNVLNHKQRDWLDVPVNGRLDVSTLDALRIYFQYRKELAEPILMKMLNCLQGARYIELAEQREKDETFIFGWFNQRVEV